MFGACARRLAISCLLALLSQPLPVLADPPAGIRWTPIPELTDEFSGDTLASAKWHDHNPKWAGREPGYFSPANVSVAEGELRLTARAENLPDLPKGYHSFTTAFVKSKTRVLYGYFETRCRPMKSAASSAFWFYDDTPDLWTEIDVMEVGGRAPKLEHTYFMTAHVFRMPGYRGTPEKHLADGSQWIAPYVLADEYHVYGLLWDKDAIVWYVDGVEVRRMKNAYWHQPLFMNFDSEIMTGWFGLPRKEDLPSTFSVSYVRSWTQPGDSQSVIYPRGVIAPPMELGGRPLVARIFLLTASVLYGGLGIFHGLRSLNLRARPRSLRAYFQAAMKFIQCLCMLLLALVLWRWAGMGFLKFAMHPKIQIGALMLAFYFALSLRAWFASRPRAWCPPLLCTVGAVAWTW